MADARELVARGGISVIANGTAGAGAGAGAEVDVGAGAETQTPHPRLHTEFDAQFQYARPRKPALGVRARRCAAACLAPRRVARALLGLFPALHWLPRYKRQDLLPDVVAGFTVAVMHIPQGMAYALLAGVQPIVGLYMAFFPVLLYVLMGTSRHISMGSFAVVCMMTSKAVLRFATPPDASADPTDPTGNNTAHVADPTADPSANASDPNNPLYTPIEVAATLALVAGVWQVVLGVFRLGALAVFMSDTLVSGFTTAAAVHVLTSQIRNLLGLTGMPVRNGALKLIYMWVDMAYALPTTNLVALGDGYTPMAHNAKYYEAIQNLREYSVLAA